MSGPKVINIEAVRRRRQREALARLRLLEDLLAHWRRARERVGTLTPAVEREEETIRRRLAALRDKGEWQALLTELDARQQFLRRDLEEAKQAHIRRVRRDRDRRRDAAIAVDVLADELRAAGLSPSEHLAEASRQRADATGGDIEKMEACLQTAIAAIAAKRQAEAERTSSDRRRAFADELMGSPVPQATINDWLAGKKAATGSDSRLAELLAEVEASATEGELSPFLEKVRAIDTEPIADRRAMLADSLMLELGAFRDRQRTREHEHRALREAIARLEPFASREAEAWRTRLESALTGTPEEEGLAQRARAWCDAEEKREDASLRREAVLRALASLGYDVREGMSAAWAENGRILVSKAGEDQYGVEITAAAASSAVQARVVAFDDTMQGRPSASRDKDAETAWCADFAKLQAALDAGGFAATIQHASPAGTVPLKLVGGDARREYHSLLNSRSGFRQP